MYTIKKYKKIIKIYLLVAIFVATIPPNLLNIKSNKKTTNRCVTMANYVIFFHLFDAVVSYYHTATDELGCLHLIIKCNDAHVSINSIRFYENIFSNRNCTKY